MSAPVRIALRCVGLVVAFFVSALIGIATTGWSGGFLFGVAYVALFPSMNPWVRHD